jgi:hypothetical protein
MDLFTGCKVALDSFALDNKAVSGRPKVFSVVALCGEIAPAAAKRN